MDASWLTAGGGPWLRALAIALLLAPTLFIAFSRRCRWWSRLLWLLSSQSAWYFAALYTFIWYERYAVAGGIAPAPGATLLRGTVLADAVGWWTFAFPWAVYLLYRGTRSRLSGEKPRSGPPGAA